MSLLNRKEHREENCDCSRCPIHERTRDAVLVAVLSSVAAALATAAASLVTGLVR
ncbi:hypothetical protein [Streptomyces vietnamensis]|uniref:hypothetical protein n=1 Tax=Streptomyces vietnamensis TaxID=362257 RepID=UPI000A506F47|nr:hypothetical protein [Streptomyces vietnamensis]